MLLTARKSLRVFFGGSGEGRKRLLWGSEKIDNFLTLFPVNTISLAPESSIGVHLSSDRSDQQSSCMLTLRRTREGPVKKVVLDGTSIVVLNLFCFRFSCDRTLRSFPKILLCLYIP